MKFIQDGVRYEGKGYVWAEQTVAEILKPNGLDDATAKRITQDIILGRGRFTGNTGDGTFMYNDEDYGTPDDFFSLFERVDNERKSNWRAYKDIQEAWDELASLTTGEIEFHRVEWGEHGEWAETYIEESGLLVDAENSRYSYSTDYLIHEKGWLLLHNPSRGKPKLTAGAKPMTKAQRETLYDYYIKAGRDEEASALFAEV